MCASSEHVIHTMKCQRNLTKFHTSLEAPRDKTWIVTARAASEFQIVPDPRATDTTLSGISSFTSDHVWQGEYIYHDPHRLTTQPSSISLINAATQTPDEERQTQSLTSLPTSMTSFCIYTSIWTHTSHSLTGKFCKFYKCGTQPFTLWRINLPLARNM
jgi:hypothetical protein